MVARDNRFAASISRRILFAAAACLLLAGAASAQTVNIREYFPLGINSFWDYTGSGQPGSSSDDDFRWTVLPADKVIGSTHTAQIKTDTVEPTDSRNGDIDYWSVNPTHRLLFYGTKIASSHSSGVITINAQDITLAHGLSMGGDGQHIGDQVTDSVPATVSTNLGNISGTINSKIVYTEIVPVVITRLGIFTDCLHVVITLKVTVAPFGSADLKGSEFFLKKNIGMVKQDQNVSASQAKDQILKDSQVNGIVIVPDGKNAAGLWTLYQ